MSGATMTDVWKYFAGDSINSVPAKLTNDQKATYRIADFRSHWGELTDSDKEWFKVEVTSMMSV